MPRIALLSDIHANVLALQAVYTALLPEADEFWVLGDIMGYGPKPKLTFDLLVSMQPTWVIAGNHDWYVLPQNEDVPDGAGWLPGPMFRREADGTLTHIGGPRPDVWDVSLRHRRSCSSRMLAALAALPVQQQVNSHIFIAHALFVPSGANETFSVAQAVETRLVSPGDFETHYLNPSAPWHQATHNKPVLHISGHTHQRELWERPRTPDGVWLSTEVRVNTPYPLKPGFVYHINPGSVGQPRNRSAPCPSAALLDTEKNQITFIEVCYDAETVRQQMRDLDYPEELYAPKQFLACP